MKDNTYRVVVKNNVEKWFVIVGGDEFLHRENGPAIVCYYDNGQVSEEVFYEMGKFRKNPGNYTYCGNPVGTVPCRICYYGDGKIKSKSFSENGEVENCIVERDVTGFITKCTTLGALKWDPVKELRKAMSNNPMLDENANE